MVSNSKENKKNFVEAIFSWVNALEKNEVLVKHEILECEEVVRMIPSKKEASSLEFRVGDFTFGVYFGKGFCFEDFDLDEALALEICAAVRNGAMEETVWCFRNHAVRTKGRLALENNKFLYNDGVDSFVGLFKCFLKETKAHYASWF